MKDTWCLPSANSIWRSRLLSCLTLMIVQCALCPLPYALAEPPTPLSITTGSELPGATVGMNYVQSLAASGGTAPYLWSVVSGALPPGTYLVKSGGITATPQVAGDCYFTAQVQDAVGAIATRDFHVAVARGTPYFTGLGSTSISFTTTPTSLSAKIAAGLLIPPGSITITLDGVSQSADINPIDGSFSTTFDTSRLFATNSPYTVRYIFPGDANFNPTDSSTNITVAPAPTTLTVTDLIIPFTSVQTNINLTATLSGLPPADLLTGLYFYDGTITFQLKDGNTKVGPAYSTPVQYHSTAILTYPLPANFPSKVYTIEASYSPGPNFGASTGTGTLTVTPETPTTVVLGLPSGGGVAKVSSGSGNLLSGYGSLSSTASSSPVAIANFSVTGGTPSAPVLISEAGVPSASPVLAARLFVDYSDRGDSGIAILNPGGVDNSITAELKSSFGSTVATTSFVLPAKTHVAVFSSQLFTGMPSPFLGTMTLTSSDPFVSTNLAESANGRQEILYYALPVADLDAPETNGSLVFSQIADGAGMKTEILLMNPSGTLPSSGVVTFYDADGAPLALDFGSFTGPQNALNFTLAPNGVVKFVSQGTGAARVGHAVVTTSYGPLPIGSAVFLFWQNSQLVSLAGIPSSPQTTSARMFVEVASSPLTRDTGVAIVNPSTTAVNVSLKLTGFDGSSRTSSLTLGPYAQVTKFVTELFPDLGRADFSGLLDVSGDTDVAVTTLRMTINERGEMIYSTLPVADLANPPTGAQYLPHFVNGGGYKTEVIVINTSSQNGVVKLSIYDDQGKIVDAKIFQ